MLEGSNVRGEVQRGARGAYRQQYARSHLVQPRREMVSHVPDLPCIEGQEKPDKALQSRIGWEGCGFGEGVEDGEVGNAVDGRI